MRWVAPRPSERPVPCLALLLPLRRLLPCPGLLLYSASIRPPSAGASPPKYAKRASSPAALGDGCTSSAIMRRLVSSGEADANMASSMSRSSGTGMTSATPKPSANRRRLASATPHRDTGRGGLDRGGAPPRPVPAASAPPSGSRSAWTPASHPPTAGGAEPLAPAALRRLRHAASDDRAPAPAARPPPFCAGPCSSRMLTWAPGP